ncbi:MAG: hypothetical protein KAI50_11770 [Desulfobacterales bacterium]|nr:hypothetical protein [Desulfobacterales bacterium]
MEKLIDEYLPLFHFSETHTTEVNAPAKEIVFGLIGKFWTSSAGILPFRPEEFVLFDVKGYAI